ncbi:MAG: hypothetical protein GF418_15215, partial [Chitinivibrionales bacterium]|nr:hypothetical protein [Chitinivibrionales bacterium]MBD3396971.1 hypothetical protein [Chitinivibrionales bacterium]
GTDEGVLVLVAVGDRAIRIEPGYGSEGYITDAKAHSIIRTVAAPHLGQGEWDDGISATMVALARLVATEKNVSLEDILSSGRRAMRPVAQREVSPIGGILIFLFILFLLFTPMGRAMLPWILLFSLGSSRRGFGGGGFGGGFGGGGFGGFGGGMSGGGGASGRF